MTSTSVPGPDPSFGMIAGMGQPGNVDAIGAILQDEDFLPLGGFPGDGPFRDGDASNDFLGRRADTDVAILMDGTAPVLLGVNGIITGELSSIHAGYGGGGGGDACLGPRFPTPNWSNFSDEKGGGGGGGGGAIRLRALGPIRFVGVNSQLLCKGARGANGENSIFVDRVGGTGGSGSGGHVILESATNISFELPPLGERLPSQRRRVFVDARGERGRIGMPTNGNGLTLPPDDSHGGHGGPGVIQLHVPNSTAPPHEDASLSDLVLPSDTIVELNAGDENALLEVMRPAGLQMLSISGALSGAQSRWVDLRNAGVNPVGPDNLINFLFEGIDPNTGLVNTDSNGMQDELAPIFGGTADPSTASFEGPNTIVFTALALEDLLGAGATPMEDLYLRAPQLLQNFVLRMTPTIGVSLDFVVQAASFDTATQSLSVTVAESAGVSLDAFDVGPGAVDYEMIPRFFGITTGTTPGSLPDDFTVRISFEGTGTDVNGNPDGENLLVEETSNVADFDALLPGELDFVRFKVEFNTNAQGNGVSLEAPLVKLNFLRLPFLY